MRRRSAVLVTVLLALVFVGVVQAAMVIGEPSMTASVADREVSPGADTMFNVTLANEGEVDTAPSSAGSLAQRVTTARGLEIRLNPGDAPVTVHTHRRTLGALPEGQSGQLPFFISVDEDAEPGVYDMNLRMWYRYTESISLDTGNYEEVDRFRSLRVSIRVTEQPEFEVENVTGAVTAGSQSDVTIGVRNVGGVNASDATLSLQSGGDVTVGSGAQTTRHVGSWPAGEYKQFNATLAAPPEGTGTAAMTSRVTYEDADGLPARSDALSVPVQIVPDRRFAITNVTSSLTVGEEGTITGEITNDGAERVENVQVALPVESPTITPVDTTAAVGPLDPGARASFSFDVEVSDDGAAGPRQFTLQPRYRTADGLQRGGRSYDVRVPVSDSTDRFAVSAVNATVEQGGSTRVAIDVTNTGTTAIDRVSAQLFADSPISTTDKQAFVDTLEAGETRTLTFGVAAGDALPKEYPLSVDFEYDNADGETKLSDTYSVALDVTEREERGLPVAGIGAGVVAVIAIGVVAVVLRRRRSRR